MAYKDFSDLNNAVAGNVIPGNAALLKSILSLDESIASIARNTPSSFAQNYAVVQSKGSESVYDEETATTTTTPVDDTPAENISVPNAVISSAVQSFTQAVTNQEAMLDTLDALDDISIRSVGQYELLAQSTVTHFTFEPTSTDRARLSAMRASATFDGTGKTTVHKFGADLGSQSSTSAHHRNLVAAKWNVSCYLASPLYPEAICLSNSDKVVIVRPYILVNLSGYVFRVSSELSLNDRDYAAGLFIFVSGSEPSLPGTVYMIGKTGTYGRAIPLTDVTVNFTTGAWSSQDEGVSLFQTFTVNYQNFMSSLKWMPLNSVTAAGSLTEQIVCDGNLQVDDDNPSEMRSTVEATLTPSVGEVIRASFLSPNKQDIADALANLM